MTFGRDPATQPGPIGRWSQDLTGELPTGPTTVPKQLRFPAIVREATLWAASAPADAWTRRSNIDSLIADLHATLSVTGAAFQTTIASAATSLISALDAVARANLPQRHPLVPAVAAAGQQLSQHLTRADVRAAAWDDLVTAARTEPSDLDAVRDAAGLLTALLDEAGIDPSNLFNRIRMQLRPPPGLTRTRVPEIAGPDTSEQDRIESCRSSVVAPPIEKHCVVWLTYGDARLSGDGQVGPVTFYESDWAVPNAQRPDGQDFPNRSELQHILEHAVELRDRDYTAGRVYEVLARVDLGHRVAYRAIEDAAAIVDTILGVVVNRTGAPAWQREHFSCLVTDGVIGSTQSGPHGRLDWIEPDHYGQNATADALSKYAHELGALFTARSLPPDVTEALRLIKEARQVDSRENHLHRTATIAEQTVIVLQASAVEHIGTYADVTNSEHDTGLLAAWPLARWQQDVAEAIGWCLQGRGGLDPLFQAVCTSSFGNWSLSAAYEHRVDLAAAAPNLMYQARAVNLFDSIRNAHACATMVDEYTTEAALLNERLKRTRNSLVHGNPVTLDTVTSVRELSRYKTDAALEAVIHSITNDQPLGTLLHQRNVRYTSMRHQLTTGKSMYEQWRAAPGTPN